MLFTVLSSFTTLLQQPPEAAGGYDNHIVNPLGNGGQEKRGVLRTAAQEGTTESGRAEGRRACAQAEPAETPGPKEPLSSGSHLGLCLPSLPPLLCGSPSLHPST